MQTNTSLSLHSKAHDILEMVAHANIKIQDSYDLLMLYNQAKPLDLVSLIYNRHELEGNVIKYKKIKARLLSYYENTLCLIVLEGIKQNVFFTDNSLPFKN